MAQRQLKLGCVISNVTGMHIASWLHPHAERFAGIDIKVFTRTARKAEAAKFDLLFLADQLAVAYSSNLETMSRISPSVLLEPLTLLSALSMATEHVGLVASATTTYNEPFHLARLFASLDHISGGRAGWNVVTSVNQDEAFNFHRDAHVAHSDRYERAREALEVVRGLWDSWDDDAFVYDKAMARVFDPKKLHCLNHKGQLFSVKGPLPVPRTPQGHPVVIQSGSSEPGMELGAETADIIFTAQHAMEEGKRFYAEVKGRLAKFGRTPDQLLIMPGIVPIVGRTKQEAKDQYDRLQELIHPDVGLEALSTVLGGVDLRGYPLDGPLPEIGESNAYKSRRDLFVNMARKENLTIRQLYQRVAGARGHRTVWGDAATIADYMEEWLVNDAADGFNVLSPYMPDALDDFIELVIPELRRRGIFRQEYEGRTLRENLGLHRPLSRYAAH